MRCGVPARLPLPRLALAGAFAVRPRNLGRGSVTTFILLFEVLEVVRRDGSLLELLRQLGAEVLVVELHYAGRQLPGNAGVLQENPARLIIRPETSY